MLHNIQGKENINAISVKKLLSIQAIFMHTGKECIQQN